MQNVANQFDSYDEKKFKDTPDCHRPSYLIGEITIQLNKHL